MQDGFVISTEMDSSIPYYGCNGWWMRNQTLTLYLKASKRKLWLYIQFLRTLGNVRWKMH